MGDVRTGWVTALVAAAAMAAFPAAASDVRDVRTASLSPQPELVPIDSSTPGDLPVWASGAVLSAAGGRVAFTWARDDSGGPIPVDQVSLWSRHSGAMTLVSVNRRGRPGNGYSGVNDLSARGRYVLFTSYASDLVPRDTNDSRDVFVRDVVAGTTRRLSVSSAGAQQNAPSNLGADGIALSANGRVATFSSVATNLVPGDTNDSADVFRHNLRTGRTTRVSLDARGHQIQDASWGGLLSADGRVVAFSTAARLVPADRDQNVDAYARNLRTGRVRLVSIAPGGGNLTQDSDVAALSADGRIVAFNTGSSTRTSSVYTAYVRNLRTGRTQVASVDAAGQARRGLVTAVSADGMLLLVQSKADLTFEEGALAPRDPDVYARNRVSGELVRVTGVSPVGDNVRSWFGADDLSSDGRWVAFTTGNALLAADQDSLVDVYLRNL